MFKKINLSKLIKSALIILDILVLIDTKKEQGRVERSETLPSDAGGNNTKTNGPESDSISAPSQT